MNFMHVWRAVFSVYKVNGFVVFDIRHRQEVCVIQFVFGWQWIPLFEFNFCACICVLQLNSHSKRKRPGYNANVIDG